MLQGILKDGAGTLSSVFGAYLGLKKDPGEMDFAAVRNAYAHNHDSTPNRSVAKEMLNRTVADKPHECLCLPAAKRS